MDWMRICASAAFSLDQSLANLTLDNIETFKSSVLQILLISGVRHGTRTAMKMTFSFGVERTSSTEV